MCKSDIHLNMCMCEIHKFMDSDNSDNDNSDHDDNSDVSLVSDDDEVDSREARKVFADLLDGQVHKTTIKKVQVKDQDPCIHCGHGGMYYQLIKVGYKYAILKFFQCLTYNMDSMNDILWVSTSLKDIPIKYKFLLRSTT